MTHTADTAKQRLDTIGHHLRQLAATYPAWSRRLREIAIDVTQLADLTHNAIHAILTNLGTIDGWPTGHNDNPVTTSPSSSNTERAAITRLAVHHTTLNDITATINALNAATHDLDNQPELERADIDVVAGIPHQLHNLIQRWLDQTLTDTDRQRMRCIGTGDQHGSTCQQWADTHGRCIDCNRRHEADRKRHRRHTNTRMRDKSA